MDTAQENWISSINSAAVSRKELVQKLEVRDQKLTELRNLIAKERDELIKNMNVKVYRDESAVESDKDGGFQEKKKKSRKDKNNEQSTLDYFERDQTAEFDWEEQFHGWDIMTDEDLEKHSKASQTVGKLLSELENATMEVPDPDDPSKTIKVPVFDESDLQEEFYTPMVREGLMAETFVPSEFSRTAQMIEGAMGEYKQRLEEDGFSKGKIFGEYAKFGLTVLSAGATMAGNVMSFKEAANLQPKDIDWSKFAVFSKNTDTDWVKKLNTGELAEQFKEANDLFGKSVDCFKDVLVEGGQTIFDKLSEKYADSKTPMEPTDQRALMASRIVSSFVAAVSTPLSSTLNTWSIGLTAANVYSSGCGQSAIVKILQQEGELTDKDCSTILTSLGSGIKSVFALCPKEIKTEADKTALEMAQQIEGVDAAAIAEQLNTNKYTEAADLIGQAAEKATKVLLKDQDLCSKLNAKKGEMSKALGDKMTEDFTKRLKEIEEQQAKDWEQCKQDPKSKKTAALIEKKILEVQKLRERTKWAKTLSSMGVAVASKFFAPLAIAGSAISLAESLTECVIRLRDAANFIDSEIDMIRDASAYSNPIKNFVRNAEIQAIHFETKALCDLISMIGAIVETAGYATGPGAIITVAVGKTMQASASSVSAIEGVMYEIAKKVDAALGWKKYKDALLRPENRKLALLAMRANPTLAKYSVAWGAIIEKDPLVADFMTKTGLTVESLEDPKANVGMVVKYLEVRMPEDNVVTGREQVAKGWAPAPAITADCWLSAIRRGKDKGKLHVAGLDSEFREIELALLQCEKPWNEIQKFEDTQPPLPLFAENLKHLQYARSLINAYRPQIEIKGKLIAHAEMKEFTVSLTKLIDVRIETLKEGEAAQKTQTK